MNDEEGTENMTRIGKTSKLNINLENKIEKKNPSKN